GAALARGGNVQGLARMAGIALADLHDGETRGRTGLVIPDAQDLGHPAGLERAPDLRGAGNALQQTGLVDRLVLRRGAQDRIVAVEDRLPLHVGTRHRVVRVVAHPLAERAFGPDLARRGLAFDGDLAIGRDGKARIGAAHDLDRLAAQAAG